MVRLLTSSFLLQASADADSQSLKKPPRSQRISGQQQPLETPTDRNDLPNPLTHGNSTATEFRHEKTTTPPESPSGVHQPTSANLEFSQPFSSPPGNSQSLSQFVYSPPRSYADEVHDEAAEGVWGYLIPLDDSMSNAFVLKQRDSYTERDGSGQESAGKKSQTRKQWNRQAPGGYLIGRHPECGQYLPFYSAILITDGHTRPGG